MKCPSYYAFFETISNKTRLQILQTLQKKSMSVSEICKNLNAEQSKISHNLKSLTQCNLLDVKKEGKKRIYSLNKETMVPLLKLIDNHVKKFCNKNCDHKK